MPLRSTRDGDNERRSRSNSGDATKLGTDDKTRSEYEQIVEAIMDAEYRNNQITYGAVVRSI
jgi:hypothetical protein